MKRLARRLDVPRYAAIGIMESLWALTARDAPQGDIGKLTDEDIAIALDWRGDEAPLIRALVESGWLDTEVPGCRLWVHDWHEHAEDAVDVKLARATMRYANGALPHMRRLQVKQREEFLERYREQARAHTVRTKPESVRTDAHESALPIPIPLPIPSPTRTHDECTHESTSDGDFHDEHAMALRIVCAHPKAEETSLQPTEVDAGDVAAVKRAIGDEVQRLGGSREMAAAVMLTQVQAIAAVVRRWPPGQTQFLVSIAKFFDRHEYRKDAQEWARDGADSQQRNGQQRGSRTTAQQRHYDGLAEIASAFPELARSPGDGPDDGPDEGELRQPVDSARVGRPHPVTLDGHRGASWDARSA